MAGTLLSAVAFASQTRQRTPSLDLLTDSTPFIIDGDTLVVRRSHVRIIGIDAPDVPDHAAKAAAKQALITLVRRGGGVSCGAVRALISHKTPPCLEPGTSFKRLNLSCAFTADRTDVALAMVSQGYAVDYLMFSGGTYQKAMNEARAAKRGLWRSSPAVMERLARGRLVMPTDCPLITSKTDALILTIPSASMAQG